MSQRKLVFFAVLAFVVLAVGITFTVLTHSKTEKGPKGPKELSVWVVGDDAAGYGKIIDSFKKGKYENTEVRIKKFANYADYEKTLVNVIADGNSPDVFMVSSEGAGVLENKIQTIPSSVISTDDFSRKFNRLFDSLILEEQGKDKDGKDVTISELRGIPMGYETMGAFYNLDLVSASVPATWSDFANQTSGTSPSGSSEADSGVSDSGREQPVFAGLGLSAKYVPNANDLVSLFFVQNGIASADRLSDGNAQKAFSDYLAFGVSRDAGVSGVEPNGNDLSRMKTEMDRLSVTSADLFARGKVGIVFGYPSYLREIQYAVKRASDENVLNKRNLKSAPIPVTDSQKPANLATYRYFAASKYSKNLEAAVDFLVHLADKNSQAAYISAFPYYLPASNELVDARKDQSVDKDFPRVKYESFLPTEGEKVVAFDGGFPTEYRDFFTSFDLVGKTPATLISDLDDMQKCLRRHLIEGANFEESCKK